jgi:hypothetical protein
LRNILFPDKTPVTTIAVVEPTAQPVITQPVVTASQKPHSSIDIEKLATKYNWKKLPLEGSQKVREVYKNEIPGFLKIDGDEKKVLYSLSGEVLCVGYRRVVIGDYGAYIEFMEDNIQSIFPTKKGQEYRTSSKYSCKYEWLCLEKDSDIKIYKQRGTVDYADYKVGLYYVSVFEVKE